MPTSTPLAPDSVSPAPDVDGPDPGAREVVVGVDGSECALGAVRWATREAALRGAPLRILHAAPYLGRRRGTDAEPPELPRARQIVGTAYTVARHTDRDVRVSTEIVPADPTTTLLQGAAAGQLVVLGSTTTGAADELVLAPVGLRVAARSPQPVVVVPRERGGAPAARPVVAVLGIGDADDDTAVATFAATAARRAGTGLELMHRGRTDAADESVWAERLPDVRLTMRALPASGAKHILAAACPSPLIVLSAGHGSLLHRTLDSPHRWLLRHCTSPMALVPPVHRPELEPREEIIALG